MIPVKAQEILDFWFKETPSDKRFKKDNNFDQTIRDRFLNDYELASQNEYDDWQDQPMSALALVILFDQFSRNMFKGSSKAFSSDLVALAAAKQAIKHKFDLAIDEPGRQFFYLPLMHSESLQDQERCIRLMFERMPLEGMNNLLHARAHREVIRKFGRFPTRNEALSRKNNAYEADYMKNGGYGMTYTQLAKSA